MSEEKKIEDGGQVYPGQFEFEGRGIHYPGITRRDWLAGLAVQGLLSDSEAMQTSYNSYGSHDLDAGKKVIADTSLLAYQIADAMIAESNK